MAPKTETMKLLRVVIREDFSRDRCETFLSDLRHSVCTPRVPNHFWHELNVALFSQIEHLEDLPQVILDHLKQGQEVRAHKKAKRSDKYVPLQILFCLFNFSRPFIFVPTSVPWDLYYAFPYYRWRRHHHQEKHSLSGKHGKTHGVSKFLSLRLGTPDLNDLQVC